MQHGILTVAAATPNISLANPAANAAEIIRLSQKAQEAGAEIVCFPELSITGYTCQDLFRNRHLLSEADMALKSVVEASRSAGIVIIVGVPVELDAVLLNCAAIVYGGKVCGVVPKTFLPNYNEFYEQRWFASSADIRPAEITIAGQHLTITPEPQLFVSRCGVKFAVEICEDLWAPVPPSCNLALAGASVVFNLSASNELAGKHQYLKSLVAQQSARTICGYVYSSSGYGESSQDVVYGSAAMICENGKTLAESDRFSMHGQLTLAQIDLEVISSERHANTTFWQSARAAQASEVSVDACFDAPVNLFRSVNPRPFIPQTENMEDSCREILNIQTMGLVRRMDHTRCHTVVIGISGGLDSTLALLVAVRAFDKLGADRKGIIGVTMPGFGTTDRTHTNALSLMESLGVTSREIGIGKAVRQHFADIGHDINVHDVTYENSQARERTQILMDLANKLGGMVVGTGDLSELALGWATYNGDHMSMYGINAGVPKTLIKYLVSYVARMEADPKSSATLMDIIDTPISPELIPACADGTISQKTEDLVGPYELHDFFIYNFMRFGFSPEKIYILACHAFGCNGGKECRYGKDTIKHWLTVFCRRFFNQQFKRSCMPDGPKVGSVSLSPRGDWRMPSDAQSALWLAACDKL